MPELAAERTTPSPRAILAVVAFGVFVAADDLTVVSTMLRPIIGDLGLVLPDGLDEAAWIVNAYLIAFVAVMPLAGRLSDRWGRRSVFLVALGLVAAGSVVTPLATSLAPFLVGRVLTALGGGAMVPVGLAAVGDAYQEPQRVRALGVIGAIETMGWVWGPLYGAMLVRFLDWRWQFWINLPLAVVGMVWAARTLPRRRAGANVEVDWFGAGALTVGLTALAVALLGGAEIQSVTGLEELTGTSPLASPWWYAVAGVGLVGFVWSERRAPAPLLDRDLFVDRTPAVAAFVNFLLGATLVIAMVDVPLFVNVVVVDIERSAVTSGWLLTALTAAMTVTAYLGGRVGARFGYRAPTVVGGAVAAVAFMVIGATWQPDVEFSTMAAQLFVLGAGFGLVIAPTTAAVVDFAPPEGRGAAASMVIVMRLLGFSVGLAALTAWGLHRFQQLRASIALPPLDDPGYPQALQRAQETITTAALADTFLAAGVVMAVAAAAAIRLRSRLGASR